MTKRPLPIVAVVLVGAMAGGAAGCGRAGGGSAAGALDRVRVSYTPFLSYGPLFIAVDEGLFRRRGIDAELFQIPVYNSTAALLHGDVDVASNFLSAGFLNAIARGERLSMVADKGHEASSGCASDALLARRELIAVGRLTDLPSIRGLRVGFAAVTAEEFWLDRLLERAGLSQADISIVNIPSDAKSGAFASGRVDVLAWSEPSLTEAEAHGAGVVWKRVADVLPGLQWGYIAYGRSLLDQRPDVGRRFMLAYLDGVRMYNEGKTERNVAAIARHTGLDREIVRRACWIAIRSDGRIDAAGILDFEHWAKAKGYLDVVLPEQRFWDPTFAEWASAHFAAGGS